MLVTEVLGSSTRRKLERGLQLGYLQTGFWKWKKLVVCSDQVIETSLTSAQVPSPKGSALGW